jgi:hypothetical protein
MTSNKIHEWKTGENKENSQVPGNWSSTSFLTKSHLSIDSFKSNSNSREAITQR